MGLNEHSSSRERTHDVLLIIITDKQMVAFQLVGVQLGLESRRSDPRACACHSTCAASLPSLSLSLILLSCHSKSLHKTPCVKCLLQFGGRKSFVSYKKLICFLFLKIRVMQLIICSFCLGCQEAQSQTVCSITAAGSFPSSFVFVPYFFLLIPFFTNIFICVSCW